MASSAQPGSEGVKDLMRKLKVAQYCLVNDALPQVRAAMAGCNDNRVRFGALVDAHHTGVAKIDGLVEIVLGMLGAPSRLSQLNGEVEGLSLLLLSLARIKRCALRCRWCILSSSDMLDSDVGNDMSSRMRFFLLRELFFNVDFARVALLIIMLEAKIHLGKSWVSRSQSKNDIGEEYCNLSAHELFEWCESKCRPVLKQRAWDLGQETIQHIALFEPAALPKSGLFYAWDIWAADPATESVEPSAEPRDSLPLEIDFKDVHDQLYLGQGSYGAVFRCSWHGKSAAMKLIKLDTEDTELERRFEMEVTILASLQHPNAVPVFGFGYTEGRAKGFFVMEQMQTDLENVIKERRKRNGDWRVFPPDMAVDIMSQIVEGMCALRLRRVIHRDLKPANILMNRRDSSINGALEGLYEVKLADFRSAKIRDDSDSVFHTLRAGTPAYMAPEVMSSTLLPERSGEQGYSWKADVYSFGMVCTEILSGERPFRHLSGMAKILAAVRDSERPELCLDGGDPLRRLIEDCWKFNAQERPDFVEVRRRLWECRVYHSFTTKEVSTSWQTFGTRSNIIRLYEKWRLNLIGLYRGSDNVHE